MQVISLEDFFTDKPTEFITLERMEQIKGLHNGNSAKSEDLDD